MITLCFLQFYVSAIVPYVFFLSAFIKFCWEWFVLHVTTIHSFLFLGSSWHVATPRFVYLLIWRWSFDVFQGEAAFFLNQPSWQSFRTHAGPLAAGAPCSEDFFSAPAGVAGVILTVWGELLTELALYVHSSPPPLCPHSGGLSDHNCLLTRARKRGDREDWEE
jgi:hypothetical protein